MTSKNRCLSTLLAAIVVWPLLLSTPTQASHPCRSDQECIPHEDLPLPILNLPEPGTVALMILGLAGLALSRRK